MSRFLLISSALLPVLAWAQTPSPSASPAAATRFFDNTAAGATPLLSGSTSVLSSSQWYGVTFAVPENDVACGPSVYLITYASLGIGMVALNSVVDITLQLYTANSSTLLPISVSGASFASLGSQ